MFDFSGPVHFGADALLWAMFVGVLWFLRRTVDKNDKEHDANRAEIKYLKSKVKSSEEILALVNGKYISRRENDLLLKESETAHARIGDRLEILEKEVDRLRNSQ